MPREDDRMGDLARQDAYEQQAAQDAFAAFAARTQRSVMPEGGRTEAPGQILGPVVHALGEPIRKGQGLLQTMRDYSANEFPETMGALAQTTDYDPRREAAGYAAGTALNLVGTPGGTGGLGAGVRLPQRVERMSDVAAGVSAPALRKVPEVDVSAAAPYVTDPIRVANPGVYKRPDVIAREAAANVAPEHEALKKLFGVTRDDLYEISKQGTRQGNIEPKIWMPSKETRGSYAADAVMNPANAQRMVDTLAEAQKYPELIKGMDPWYVMDPMYQRMVKLVGPEEAKLAYAKFNATVGPFSAGSNVPTEINRGTAAHMGVMQGNYPEFKKYAGVAESKRGSDYPDWLRDVKGHAYHGVQADPVTRWLAAGEHGYANDTVKIPLYIQASGVPQTGFQTRLPVPDAHFTRAAGMPDVRKNQNFNDYMGGSEYRPFGSWYRENVAKPLGIEAVPAQARMWGTYAPQTGVDTKIGAGKLELIAQNIWERAKKLGIDPKVLRDQVLRGKNHATWLAPGAGVATMGGLAAQDEYGR